MKKHNILSLALSFLLAGSVLSGCATTSQPSPASTPAASTPAASAPAAGTSQTAPEATVGQKPENYPKGNITWIVPAAAGAAIDVPTRTVIEHLDLGTNIVVENIAGASQTIGTAETKNRAADGQTLLTGANGGLLLQPSLVDLTYDSFADFRHIAMIASPDPMAIAVKADSKITSVEDLFKRLDQGERLTWSFSNSGGIGHLAFLDLCTQKNYKTAEYVPFNGSSEILTALLGGHIDFIVLDASVIAQRAGQGQVKPLAVMSSTKLETLPDVPAISDYGINNMDAYVGYKWLAVRADTPDEIVQWLKGKVNEATQSEAYQKFLKENYFVPLKPFTEEEVTQTLKNSYESCGEMLTVLGLHK